MVPSSSSMCPSRGDFLSLSKSLSLKLKFAARFPLTRYSSKKSPVIYAAWRHIPTTYLVCENDKALTPDTQEFIIKRDKENGSNVTVERCMASHPPLLSMPEKVVEVIRWAAGESI